MTTYRLSPRARADLGGIWDHTAERWGEGQAERYLRQIAEACADLASGRRRGAGAGAVRPGYFRHPVGSHVLFYRLGRDGGIEVMRILHKRMDVGRHL